MVVVQSDMQIGLKKGVWHIVLRETRPGNEAARLLSIPGQEIKMHPVWEASCLCLSPVLIIPWLIKTAWPSCDLLLHSPHRVFIPTVTCQGGLWYFSYCPPFTKRFCSSHKGSAWGIPGHTKIAVKGTKPRLPVLCRHITVGFQQLCPILLMRSCTMSHPPPVVSGMEKALEIDTRETRSSQSQVLHHILSQKKGKKKSQAACFPSSLTCPQQSQTLARHQGDSWLN